MVAVNDGTIKRIGHNSKLGNYIVLQDTYGNRFTYAQLGHVAKVYPVPKQRKLSASDFKLVTPKRDKAPSRPATRSKPAAAKASDGPVNTEDLRQRLYALPERPHNVDRADITGQLDQLLSKKFPGYETFKSYFGGVLHFNRDSMELRPLRKGSQVVAGTVLGRIGKKTDKLASHLNFAIRPAGRGAPRIDPKPILDGWKLLEATAIYRAAGKNPFSFSSTNVSQILLMPKTQLERRVLADPRLSIYECGRVDIRTGQIDQRVLAAMEYLAGNGFRLTITSLKCGHSVYTSGGNISEHSTGDAMDIAGGQRDPDPRQPGQRLDHRGGGRDPAAAPGHDAAAPADLAHGPRRAVVLDGRPRRPHPRRLLPEGPGARGEQAVRRSS